MTVVFKQDALWRMQDASSEGKKQNRETLPLLSAEFLLFVFQKRIKT